MLLPLWAVLLPPNSTKISFVLFYILGIGSSSSLALLFFLLLHFLFYTLHTIPLLFLSFLLSSPSSFIFSSKAYTTYYLFVLGKKIPILSCHGFGFPSFYILHILYRLPLSYLWFILFLIEVLLPADCFLFHSIPVPFSILDMLVSSSPVMLFVA